MVLYGDLTLSAPAAWTWTGSVALTLTAWSSRWRSGSGQAALVAWTGWRTTASASVTLALWTAWKMATQFPCWTHHLPVPLLSLRCTTSIVWWGILGAWPWICHISKSSRVGKVATKHPEACPVHHLHLRHQSLSRGALEIEMQIPPWLKTAFSLVTTSHWGSPSTVERYCYIEKGRVQLVLHIQQQFIQDSSCQLLTNLLKQWVEKVLFMIIYVLVLQITSERKKWTVKMSVCKKSWNDVTKTVFILLVK